MRHAKAVNNPRESFRAACGDYLPTRGVFLPLAAAAPMRPPFSSCRGAPRCGSASAACLEDPCIYSHDSVPNEFVVHHADANGNRRQEIGDSQKRSQPIRQRSVVCGVIVQNNHTTLADAKTSEQAGPASPPPA